MRESKVHFANLNILRFIACFMVMIAHALEEWITWYPNSIPSGGETFLEKLRHHFLILVKNGGIGVDVFFLISGFLITYLLLVEKERFGKIDVPKFYLRRMLRIWPVYFLVVALAPAICAWVERPQPEYWPTILLYNNYHTIDLGYWPFPFAHLWSICVEEHFYFVWPLLLTLIPLRHLLQWCLGLILCIAGYKLILFWNGASGMWYYLDSICRSDVLLVGAIGAWLYFKKPFVLRTPMLWRLAALLGLLCLLSLEPYFQTRNAIEIVGRKFIYVGLLSFLMLNFMFHEKPLWRIGPRNPMQFLGKISYGMYMFSNVLVAVVMKRMIVKWEMPYFWFYIFLNIFCTVLVSWLCYIGVERFFLRWKRKAEVVSSHAG